MPLSETGHEEATAAGKLLRKDGFIFDVAYTSVLKRAISTLWHVLEELDLMWIPVHRDWRLNERHYGGLQVRHFGGAPGPRARPGGSSHLVTRRTTSVRLTDGRQGLNKAETAAKHGDDQVKIWRRSYAIPPPELDEADDRHPSKDPRYAGVDPATLPKTESLKLTVDRFLPAWHETIAPAIRVRARVGGLVGA